MAKGEEIMKKRSFWIIFMSALFCLSMMLAACSEQAVDEVPTDTETVTETETETEAETEKVVPTDKEVNYAAILGEWSKYLTAVGEKENGDYTDATYMFKDKNGENTSYDAYVSAGKLARVKKTTKAEYDSDGDLISPGTNTIEFYNIETGEKILSVSDKSYNTVFGLYNVVYSADIYLGAIIEVEKSEWKNLGDEENPDWQYEVSYSYYDNSGNVLVKNTEDRAVLDYDTNCLCVSDKAYHCNNGEIILITHANDTYPIPNFGIEYENYRYSFVSEYENRIQVLNEKYELVADYLVPGYLGDSVSYFILENRDVYIFAIDYVDSDSENYDFVEGDVKYKVWHKILSVTTGEITDVEASFIPSNFLTKYETDESGIDLNGEYQYAEIRRIKDGKLAKDTEYVILDNALGEIANLPKIFENQISVVSGLKNGCLIVEVKDLENDVATYMVALDCSKLQRCLDYEDIDGGFIANGKVYNNDFKVVFELEDVESYSIYAGAILYTEIESVKRSELEAEEEETDENSTEPDPDEEIDVTYTYVGYINSTGEFKTKKIATDSEVSYFGYGFYTVKNDDGTYLYNRLGNSISLSGNDSIVNIQVENVFEDSIVIRTAHDSGSGDAYAIEYKYFVIK